MLLRLLKDICSPGGAGSSRKAEAGALPLSGALPSRVAGGESGAADDTAIDRLYRRVEQGLAEGDLTLAEACCRKVLDLRPEAALAHVQLARVRLAQRRLPEASECLNRAETVPGLNAKTRNRIGIVWLDLEDCARAETCFRSILATDGAHAYAWCNLGIALQRKGDLEEALSCFRRALELKPDFAEAMHNCGLLLRDLGRPADALAMLERALSLNPEFALALANIGVMHQDLGDIDGAFAAFDRALELAPESGDIHLTKAHLLLSAGRFREGWREQEYRRLAPEFPRGRFPFPEWEGEDLTGKNLLVYAEQGIGDEIMLAGCFPDLLAKGGRCVIECDPRLETLYRRSFPQAEFAGNRFKKPDTWLEAFRPIDLQIPIGSLPWFFRNEEADFPRHSGYLVADPQRIGRWKERLSSLGPGLKIGLSWRGGTSRTNAYLRSIPLESWLPVLKPADAHFVNLQYTDCRTELGSLHLRHGIRIHSWPELESDYEETAALVASLDLVISVCTAVVHLAGALGAPVWVLVPSSPGWRYLRDREGLPWYPSARLFRQAAPMDWAPVLQRVAAELPNLANRRGPSNAGGGPPIRAPLPSVSVSKAEDFYRQGLVEKANENTESAISYLERAIDADPEYVPAYSMLGALYCERGELTEADYCFRMGLRYAPGTGDLLLGLARNCVGLGDRPEAISLLAEARAGNWDSADFLFRLALYYGELYETDSAVEVWRRVIELRPTDALAHNNLGLQWHFGKGDPHRAKSAFERALELHPHLTEARFNLCSVLADLGEVDAAVAGFDRMRDGAFHDEAMFHRAVVLLKSRRFGEGWPDYRYRWGYQGAPRKPAGYPDWQGEPCEGETLLVFGEQGLGDEIMFASCLADLRARVVGRITLQCDVRLETLFRRSFPELSVVGVPSGAAGRPEAVCSLNHRIDYQVAMGDLPGFFRRDEASFPRHAGYLRPAPERVDYWRGRLSSLGEGPKIGISWQGGQDQTRRRLRSIPLDEWLPILTVEGAHFVSLQYTDCQDELRALAERHGIIVHHWQEAIDDYDETAALVSALDQVVTVCTSVVHLTGALGKPAWVLVPTIPEWRYLNAGASMPWYPSVRLFRQPRQGAWQDVLEEVGRRLRCVNCG
jgi:tetratricopeptide (TPR) repeat protein